MRLWSIHQFIKNEPWNIWILQSELYHFLANWTTQCFQNSDKIRSIRPLVSSLVGLFFYFACSNATPRLKLVMLYLLSWVIIILWFSCTETIMDSFPRHVHFITLFWGYHNKTARHLFYCSLREKRKDPSSLINKNMNDELVWCTFGWRLRLG